MFKSTILTFLLLLTAFASLACSCSRYSVIKGIKNADLVFTGKVLEITDISHNDTLRYNKPNSDSVKIHVEKDYLYSFKFQIQTLHKGQYDSSTVEIISSGGGADCGMYFEKDSEHLIYTTLSDKKHWKIMPMQDKVEPFFMTHLCTRTKKKSKVKIFESFILFVNRLF